MKRLFSGIFSVVFCWLCCCSCVTALADSYENTLKKAGFSEGYIAALTALHQKYPAWEFVALDTGLNWSTAVAGERAAHKNQIIAKSSTYGDAYYCACSQCKVNGKYVVRYGSSCVAASEWAVAYFMDPRNWLDETHIFEFESTAYNAAQTQSGVEAILASTWMKNALISYKTTEGKTETLNKKYSAVIMETAQASGLGAYYLASRIVKEVGAAKPTAQGVCGMTAPFNGIYNYYSIGAYSSAKEGLEWASGFLKTAQNTPLFSSYDKTNKVASEIKEQLKKGQRLVYISSDGNYNKVQLYDDSYAANNKVGYVAKNALNTTYFTYERPWTTPAKSILGGAQYIAKSYLTQYTPYLQKFNVNPASETLYAHEYMANVDAVGAEAVSAYNAYKKAGELNKKKVFYIPVFRSMPASTASAAATSDVPAATTASGGVSGLKIKSTSVQKITFSWNAYDGASKYYIAVKNKTKKTTFSKTVKEPSATISNLTAGNQYEIKVKAYAGGKWSKYSAALTAKALPQKVTIKKLTASGKGKILATWKKVSSISGYQVYYAKDKKFKKIVAKKNFSSKTVKYTGKNFTKGKKYYVKVRAYKKVNGKKYYGKWSSIKSVKVK